MKIKCFLVNITIKNKYFFVLFFIHFLGFSQVKISDSINKFSVIKVLNSLEIPNFEKIPNYIIFEKFTQNTTQNNLDFKLITKEDSISYNLAIQKNKFIDYIQKQSYFFDENKIKKIISSEKTGINKNNFLDYYDSSFSIKELKNDSILINSIYFINPISNFGLNYFNFNSLEPNKIYFSKENYDGFIFINSSMKKIESIHINKKIFTENSDLKIIFDQKDYFIQELYFKNIKLNEKRIETILDLKFIKSIYKLKIEKSIYNKWIKNKKPFELNEQEKNTFLNDNYYQTNNKNFIFLNNFLNNKKIVLGYLDLKPYDFVSYNAYEGFRFQIGASTNEFLSKKISLKNYIAFGLNDQKFKFGSFVDYKINPKKDILLKLGYQNDVNPAGRFSDFETKTNSLLKQVGNFNYSKFFHLQEFSSSITNLNLASKLSSTFGINYQINTPKFDYLYQNNTNFESYNLFLTKINLFWAPNKKQIQTNYGKITLKDESPYIDFNLQKSMKIFDSDFDFTKIQLRIIHSHKILKGDTKITLKTGIILNKAPLTHLFEGLGTAKNNSNLFDRLSISSTEYFETMIPGTFFMDKYSSLFLDHELNSIKILNKKYTFHLLYKALIGNISKENKQNNERFNFDVPKDIYQELGIEMPNLFFKKMIGFGAYYRIGAYSEKTFDKNFFIKFVISL